MSNRLLGTALGALILLQLGILVGQALPPAWAGDATGTDDPMGEVFRDPPRLLCKMFTVPLEGAGSMFETSDLNTEVGRWVQSEEDLYDLFSVDFEVGQKATGYPQGYAQVCLAPR